jgi:hypothetical protein
VIGVGQAHEQRRQAYLLNDLPLRKLPVPSVRDLIADGSYDARAFSRFENDHDCIGVAHTIYGPTNSSRRLFGASKIGMLRFVARSFTQR